MLSEHILPSAGLMVCSGWPFTNQKVFFQFSFYLFLFLAMLGLCCSVDVSVAAASEGYSLAAMHRFLIVAASVTAEHELSSMQASVVAAHGLSSCGSQALERRLGSCGT